MNDLPEGWWLKMISVKAAIREQFPPLAKVLLERPGSATDRENKRLYKEAAELSKEREQRLRAERRDHAASNRRYKEGRASVRPSSMEAA